MTRVFPSRTDYELIIQHLDKCAHQPELKRARVEMQANGVFPQVFSGGRAVVFPVQIDGSRYALKCWIQSLGDLPDRYQKISRFASEKNPSFLIDSEYLDDELLVNGRRYPALRMVWSDSLTLKDWINLNISNSSALSSLACSFLELCQEMHALNFSHGDLQHENILVNGATKLVLVDYDSAYIPGLENLHDEIKGLPGYQHKSRADLRFSRPYVDYLSEYVIYISLFCLSLRPQLWDQVKDHNRLLFSEEDIRMPKASLMIKELGSIPELKDCIDAFVDNCACTSIDQIVPLDQALPLNKMSASRGDSPQSPVPQNSGRHLSRHETKADESHPHQVWRPNGHVRSQDPWEFTPRTPNQSPSSDVAEAGSTAALQIPNGKRVVDDLRDAMLLPQGNQQPAATPRSAQADSNTPGRPQPAESTRAKPMRSSQAVSNSSQIPADSGRLFSYKTIREICACTRKSEADVQRAMDMIGCREPFTRIEADRIAAILTGDPSIKRAFDRNGSHAAVTTSPPAPDRSSRVVPEGLDNQSEMSTAEPTSDCFVASVLYGSSSHPDVVALRKFRDTVLMSSRSGKQFVQAYYRFGPQLAKLDLFFRLGFLRVPLSWFVRFLVSR